MIKNPSTVIIYTITIYQYFVKNIEYKFEIITFY